MESIYRLVDDSMARHGVIEGAAFLPDLEKSREEESSLDHIRLEWSRWFRCESSFSVLLVPAKPGIFALGEEIVRTASEYDPQQRVEQGFQPCIDATNNKKWASAPEVRNPPGKRMLALFRISETDDLGVALGRMFLPGNPLLRKLNSGRCFARYAVIEDATQRSAAHRVFQRWMEDSGETVSGISPRGAGAPALDPETCGADTPVREGAPSLSSVNFARQGGEVDFPCGSNSPARAETINDVTPDSDLVQAVPPSISSAWGAGFLEVQNRETSRTVRRPAPLPSGF